MSGVLEPSASIRCVVTLPNDKKVIVTASQTTSSQSYHGLQAPFSIIGIGKSNNFIEELTVGVFSEGKRVLRSWTPIIPKSVIFVSTESSASEANWTLTQMLNPTSKIPLILFADGVFLLALGLILIVAHLKEKAEDDKEKESI